MSSSNRPGHQRSVVRPGRPARAGTARTCRDGSWRAAGPSMAHGCAAPSPAVGPAPVAPQPLYIILLLTAFFCLSVGNICLQKISELIIHPLGVNP